MKVVSVDQFEFEDAATEEALDIAIAKKSAFPHPSVQAFVEAAVGIEAAKRLQPAVAFSDQFAYGKVREYLQRFAKWSLPDPCSWPTHILAEGPDEWHLVLCGPDIFVSYRWSTSA